MSEEQIRVGMEVLFAHWDRTGYYDSAICAIQGRRFLDSTLSAQETIDAYERGEY